MDVEIAFHHLRLPRKRFEISTGVRENVEVFIVEARHDNLIGFGSGTPATSVGDSPKKCEKALGYAMNVAIDPELYFDNEVIRNLLEISPAGAAAVDIAMWDLRAKMDGVSVARVLGSSPKELPTDATIDIRKPDDAGELARRLAGEGFKTIKVKIGRSLTEDLERVKAVRNAVGPDIGLFVDANGGYDCDKALKFWKQAASLKLEFFEQPVPPDKVEDFANLRGQGIVLCADESISTEASLIRLIDLQAVDIVNLKLMKCGGLSEAIRLEEMARDAGIRMMIGCMGDIGISIAAAAHFACSAKAEYVDLDSHLSIQRICDGPEVRSGRLMLGDEPGLGIHLIDGWQKWRA